MKEEKFPHTRKPLPPVCKHRSLSTHPLGACAAHRCQSPVIQGQVPQENTWCASGCCNVTLASVATGSTSIPIIITIPLPPPSLNDKSSLISCCFKPILSGWEQKPEDNLHAETGPKQKLNPRSCANEEEKGKSLPAASGAVD